MVTNRLRSRRRFPKTTSKSIVLAISTLVSLSAQAQQSGVTTQGSTGGLVIPSARVLGSGNAVFTYGNYQEPQLGDYPTQQNFSVGLGFLPGLEIFGRLANYNDPGTGFFLTNGIRDLSANIKISPPTPWKDGPQWALGVNDVTGGAVNFKSAYGVVSHQWGPLSASLGYAQSGSTLANKSFDGAFGGFEYQLGSTGLALLAEHDGQQKHAGVRWQSKPVASMGNAHFRGTVQRSIGAVYPDGKDADDTRLAFSVLLPFGGNVAKLAKYQPANDKALPPLSATEGSTATKGMVATDDDRMAALKKAMVAVGLERVRVGLTNGALGSELVVEYENHRYAHNEADAIGLVLGLGAELAPKGVQRVKAITLKDGLAVYQTSVGVAVYRAFLRDGLQGQVRVHGVQAQASMFMPLHQSGRAAV